MGRYYVCKASALLSNILKKLKSSIMKRIATYAFALLLSACSLKSIAQQNNNRPKLFSNFPDIINCSETELSRVFTIAEGQNISLSFSNNFIFAGNLSSSIVKYSNLHSTIIKSPVFNNAIFNLSKRINDDNSITYVGRIINTNYGDMYELKKDISGNYQLVKTETSYVIQDCAHQ